MKKLIALMLALAMVCTLAACGGDSAQPTEAITSISAATEAPAQETEAPAETGDVYAFSYKGTRITMNEDTAPILEALGESKNYTEEESCAFEGLHKTYYYGSFYLQTYPDGETDRVYTLWLADDSVSTEEGIYIGATQQQVEDAYGAENYNGMNAFVMTSGDSTLTVSIENGTVSSIQYTAITD